MRDDGPLHRFGAPAGYALSRFDFPGKEAFRFLVMMTRAFPLPLLALPLAVMFIRTGLDDTILGLALVHTTLALPFAVLITFSLFSGIPLELEEAAWTLGCTRVQAFLKVILPLALPGHRRLGGLRLRHLLERGLRRRGADHREPHADRLPACNRSTSRRLPLKFAGGAALVLPALIFIFAVRKYLFAMWGIANRVRPTG